jgi:outer membrane protein assembly factor BamB/ketosteroid isomerase-like protein
MSPSLVGTHRLGALALLCSLAFAAGPLHADDPPLAAADLAGRWAGEALWTGSRAPFAVLFEAGPDGALAAKFSLPDQHAFDYPLGPATLDGREVRFGPFVLTFDRAAGTLSGTLPAALVPVHTIPVTLRRTDALERPARAELTAPVVPPVWTYQLGAPAWADVAASQGLVFAGADDGRLHALEARTGKPVWAVATGGALRARPTVAGPDLYVQSDDGFLYRLDTKSGAVRFKVRVAAGPIVRIPNTDPKTRADIRASAVTVADGTLYLGTHDGHVLALDAETGARRWAFKTKDSVLAAPALAGGKLFVGCYDGRVHALDAATGRELWAYDTHAPVTSTPVPVGDVVVVGSRSYDLLGLDAATGREVWKRYIWYSWIESTAAVRDGVAYLGSSDAAKVFALDPKTGAARWEADVHGINWGQPAVTATRVFVGTQGSHFLIDHAAAALALDRETGEPVWRFPLPAPGDRKPHGFAGSPAVGSGLVFLAALDGTLYAFDAAAPALPSVALPPGLERVLRDYETAWRARDGAALARLFAEDGFVLSGDSPPVRSRAAIEKHYRNAGGALVLRAFHFVVGGDLAIILGGFAREPGQPDVGKFTLTLRKGTDGRWLIVSDMDNGNQREP